MIVWAYCPLRTTSPLTNSIRWDIRSTCRLSLVPSCALRAGNQRSRSPGCTIAVAAVDTKGGAPSSCIPIIIIDNITICDGNAAHSNTKHLCPPVERQMAFFRKASPRLSRPTDQSLSSTECAGLDHTAFHFQSQKYCRGARGEWLPVHEVKVPCPQPRFLTVPLVRNSRAQVRNLDIDVQKYPSFSCRDPVHHSITLTPRMRRKNGLPPVLPLR